MATLDEISENMAALDDWEDRYRYVIDLGRMLEPLPDTARTEDNRVRGCASQVWVETAVREAADGPHLVFRGDSDALIVKGLVALTLAIYSDKPASDILATDAFAIFDRFGLKQHLTAQRSNGLRSMVDRIQRDAQRQLATA